MKKTAVLMAMLLTSFTTLATEHEQEFSCHLTQESLNRLDGYIDPGGLGIWFQSIPENFQLAISNNEILLNYNYKESIGIKGQSFEKAWDDQASIRFANYSIDNRNGSKYGSKSKSSAKITDKIATGKYASQYLSPITYSGKKVELTYKVKFDKTTLTGTLKTTNKLNGYFAKFSKYNLDFTCN